MPIPAGVEKVTVTDGGVALTGPDGTPLEGSFTVTGPDFATVKEDDFLFGGFARRWVTAGRFDPLTLVATDATGIDPTGFTYTVVFTPKRGTAWTRYIALPKASPSVVLADILIPDPVTGAYTPGSSGSGTPASSVTAETSYGQASQVGSSSTYARGDHTHGTPALPTPGAIGAEPAGTAATTVSSHSSAADPHGDRSWADSKFALATGLTSLTGTVNNLSASVTAIDGFLNDCLNRVAAIEQGTAWLSGLQVNGNAQIANGSLAVTGNALGEDTPAAHGIAAWVYDPALAVNSTQLTAGTLYLVRVNIAAALNATKIYWWVANTGSGATASQNWAGLYSSAGTLLASANVDSSFSTATLKTTTIASTALAAGSFAWVALLFNASVTPTLTRASGWTGVDTAANLGLSASAYRFARNGAGLTALPSSITPASNVGTDFAGPWVAIGA